jgi:hypothetical protein
VLSYWILLILLIFEFDIGIEIKEQQNMLNDEVVFCGDLARSNVTNQWSMQSNLERFLMMIEKNSNISLTTKM